MLKGVEVCNCQGKWKIEFKDGIFNYDFSRFWKMWIQLKRII